MELSVIVRRPIRFECEATGQPQPSINWLKDGREISPEAFQNMRIADAGKVLQIISAQSGDTGSYTCSAENVAGRTNKRYSLQVHCKYFK
ncbi:hypothetical protein CAPTEDRAFT_142739 [Capitella teleta]|uniref:Ig-like domain-containing protein n=2 Tax=Capitella teleta TaxID=283909 RepID=R7U905_CAPTE|nr:hypothetical protein CAPTEDRAFT_142739 [Capitella teleta]|eukprot:ELU02424.1 hypothetical protein CAPTEDRAFT_142739 [Capitella teleta]